MRHVAVAADVDAADGGRTTEEGIGNQRGGKGNSGIWGGKAKRSRSRSRSRSEGKSGSVVVLDICREHVRRTVTDASTTHGWDSSVESEVEIIILFLVMLLCRIIVVFCDVRCAFVRRLPPAGGSRKSLVIC